ncbi:uncharacterized protein EDB93DRAFT_1184119 [Suillus bovinus]|uniref:uncharacterized protein n=1 Tax=Suillus bovinus TaxID=48563 RepID=UPI001B86DEA7|nr:uncharacterized protein EDB93DRAFT_1184119 [Suillus bovinus]KAG2128645.1 hypothetical protein EDB93DRAFT_1184119 [Suillus bovinus]
MHFSFLAVIIALAASIMSVSEACSDLRGSCRNVRDQAGESSVYCHMSAVVDRTMCSSVLSEKWVESISSRRRYVK